MAFTYRRFETADDAARALRSFRRAEPVDGWTATDILVVEKEGPYLIRFQRTQPDATDPSGLGGSGATAREYMDATTARPYERRTASPDARLVPPDARVILTYHGSRYHPLVDRDDFSWCGLDDSIGRELVTAVEAWKRGVELCGHCRTAILKTRARGKT